MARYLLWLGVSFLGFSAIRHHREDDKEWTITDIGYEVVVVREVDFVFYGRAETSARDFLGLWERVEAHAGAM